MVEFLIEGLNSQASSLPTQPSGQSRGSSWPPALSIAPTQHPVPEEKFNIQTPSPEQVNIRGEDLNLTVPPSCQGSWGLRRRLGVGAQAWNSPGEQLFAVWASFVSMCLAQPHPQLEQYFSQQYRSAPWLLCAHSWWRGCLGGGNGSSGKHDFCTPPWVHERDGDTAASSSLSHGGDLPTPAQPFPAGRKQMWPPPVRESGGCSYRPGRLSLQDNLVIHLLAVRATLSKWGEG